MGAILAHEINKRLVIVRKNTEKCHSYYTVENGDDNLKLVFIDDLIASGSTLRNLAGALKQRNINITICGAAFYEDSCNNAFDHEHLERLFQNYNVDMTLLAKEAAAC